MRFELLGTGTSQGVPVIGCDCATCTSQDPRDNRLRCSALIQSQQHSIVIDVGPDFRQQMLRSHVNHLDAVLITHEHNDHIIGLDDLRPFMFRNMKPMTVYAERRVLDEIEERFAYAFIDHAYPGAPKFELKAISPGDNLVFGDIHIKAIRIMHGRLPILGFIVNDKLAYLTDTNHIGDEEKEELADLEVLILDMLRQKSHHSHFSLEQSVQAAQEIGAASTYFLHMSHLMGPTKEWEQILPPDVYPTYDGLTFDL